MNRIPERLPTFMILGAAKCGTTSLAYYLSQHPEIFFSDPKEPTFFEAEYEKGLEHYVASYFKAWNGEAVIGEGRVWNLYLPFVPERIRESLPDARLIAVLRDPVERAYSHWWHRVSRGLESLSFERAVEEDRRRIERGENFSGAKGEAIWRKGLYPNSPTTRLRVFVDLGFYEEQLQRYRALYPASQIEVVLYEDLAHDLAGTLRRIHSFVGVDPEVLPPDRSAQNVRRGRVRGAAARRLQFAFQSTGLPRLVPRRLRAALRGALFHGRAARRPPLDPRSRAELVSYYEPHTARLESMLGRDLSAWRLPTADSTEADD